MYNCLVFAGPNGSGKSTVTSDILITGVYINADEIQKSGGLSVQEATKEAQRLCYTMVDTGRDFTFETVLSSPYKLELLSYAKEKGYTIKAIFVLTNDPNINIRRVKARVDAGGHDVPVEKIVDRYYKSIRNIPKLVEIADETIIYDNSGESAEKLCFVAHDIIEIYKSTQWSRDDILNLLINQI